jgi:hypothetical protein
MSDTRINTVGPKVPTLPAEDTQKGFLTTSSLILSIYKSLFQSWRMIDRVNSDLKEADLKTIERSHKTAVSSLRRQAAEQLVGGVITGGATLAGLGPEGSDYQKVGKVAGQAFPHFVQALTKVEEGVQSTAQMETSLSKDNNLEQRREETRRIDSQRDGVLNNIQRLSDEDAKSFKVIN